MRKVEYGKTLAESWKIVANNPVSFFPIIYSVVALSLYVGLGLLSAWMLSGFEWAALSEHVVGLVVVACFWCVGLLFLLFHVAALQLAVYWPLSLMRSVSVSEAFLGAKTWYWRMARLQLTKFLLAIPLMVLVLEFVIFFGSEPLMKESGAGLIILAIVLFILLAVFYGVLVLFAEPFLMRSSSSFGVIAQCWRTLRSDPVHVWKTFGLVVLLSLSLSVFFSMIMVPFDQESSLYGILRWMNSLVQVLVSIWTTVFVYRCFVKRYK